MRKIGTSKRRLKKEKKKFNKQLLFFLENENISVSHSKVCFIILFRIYMRIKRLNKYFNHISIHNQELLIDGHHRYIAYRIANVKFDVKPATKCYHQKPPFFEIRNLIVDYNQDWDFNAKETIKQNNVNWEINDDYIKFNNFCKVNF